MVPGFEEGVKEVGAPSKYMDKYKNTQAPFSLLFVNSIFEDASLKNP